MYITAVEFVNEKLSAAKICRYRSKHVSLNDLQPCAELSKVAELSDRVRKND